MVEARRREIIARSAAGRFFIFEGEILPRKWYIGCPQSEKSLFPSSSVGRAARCEMTQLPDVNPVEKQGELREA